MAKSFAKPHSTPVSVNLRFSLLIFQISNWYMHFLFLRQPQSPAQEHGVGTWQSGLELTAVWRWHHILNHDLLDMLGDRLRDWSSSSAQGGSVRSQLFLLGLVSQRPPFPTRLGCAHSNINPTCSLCFSPCWEDGNFIVGPTAVQMFTNRSIISPRGTAFTSNSSPQSPASEVPQAAASLMGHLHTC